MNRRGALMFLTLGIIWGIPYLLIKVAVAELEPATLVLARTVLAALILLPIAAARRELLPVLRRWKPLLAFAAAEIALPWYFLNSAERTLPSSTAALLLAAVPLAGVGIAFLMGRSERLTGRNWLGLAFGVAGVAALVGLDVAGSDMFAVAEMAVVVIGYAVGPAILVRWMSDLPSLGIIALSLAATAVAYAPFVLASGAWPAAMPSAQTVGSVVVLAVLCSATAFLLLFSLIKEIGPVRATAIVYVNTAVAVAAGALVLHEEITVWKVVGFVLVLAGSYFVTQRRATTVD